MGISMGVAPRVEDPTELAHERYSALVRAVATVVWTATPDGGTRVGSDWTTLTGQTTEEMTGYGWLDAIHPEDRERTREAWRTAVLHQGVYDTDYRIRCADGIHRWFNARGAPVLDHDGAIREWVGMCLPITGSKRFQVDLRIPGSSTTRLTAAQVRAARALLVGPSSASRRKRTCHRRRSRGSRMRRASGASVGRTSTRQRRPSRRTGWCSPGMPDGSA